MSLDEKIWFNQHNDGCLYSKEVKQSIKELKVRGLKRTTYPKYLMLTIDDLIEIFGKGLI